MNMQTFFRTCGTLSLVVLCSTIFGQVVDPQPPVEALFPPACDATENEVINLNDSVQAGCVKLNGTTAPGGGCPTSDGQASACPTSCDTGNCVINGQVIDASYQFLNSGPATEVMIFEAAFPGTLGKTLTPVDSHPCFQIRACCCVTLTGGNTACVTSSFYNVYQTMEYKVSTGPAVCAVPAPEIDE